MATCEICGADFDARGVQFVVPGVAKGYDSVDCAVRARALHARAGGATFGPRPAVFTEIAGTRPGRKAAGLSAALAGMFGGFRTRVALGGASAAVAAVVATASYLSLSGSGGADDVERSARPPQPLRYGAVDRTGTQTAHGAITEPEAVFEKSNVAPDANAALASVQSGLAVRFDAGDDVEDGAIRLGDKPQGVVVTLRKPRPHTKKPTRQFNQPARHPASQPSPSVSTRPGWGRGDKNHTHVGPPKRSASAHGKARGHQK